MKHKIVYNDCYGGYTLSDKAIEWLSEHGSDKTKRFIAQKRLEANKKTKYDSSKIFYVMDALRYFLKRHDPDLIAVVEALGKEVNGSFSDLAIEEIDGDMYNIEEYDGKETVVTPDDIGWIVIS